MPTDILAHTPSHERSHARIKLFGCCRCCLFSGNVRIHIFVKGQPHVYSGRTIPSHFWIMQYSHTNIWACQLLIRSNQSHKKPPAAAVATITKTTTTHDDDSMVQIEKENRERRLVEWWSDTRGRNVQTSVLYCFVANSHSIVNENIEFVERLFLLLSLFLHADRLQGSEIPRIQILCVSILRLINILYTHGNPLFRCDVVRMVQYNLLISNLTTWHLTTTWRFKRSSWEKN